MHAERPGAQMKVLVTGGVRSGKSRHAEGLLAGRADVVYVALGPTPDTETDPDWTARVERHRAGRPATWDTVETSALSEAIPASGAALVDCLGTWLARIMDEADLWDADAEVARAAVLAHSSQAVDRLGRTAADVVVVTNEVGLGVVPEHRSGRTFRDLLGLVNQQFAEQVDEVHLVIAGRVLVL